MKSILDSVDGLSEEFKAEYEQKDGKFHLKLEDIPSGYVKAQDLLAANTKVVEFRDRNIALLKENDELRPLKLKYEGIDPEEAKIALEKVKALSKKGIKDVEDFNAQVKAVAEELVKPLREQLSMSAAETAAERKRADESLLHSKVSDVFAKIGGKANATDFVVNLAKDIFEVKDRAIVAKAGKFSSTKPGDPITVDEWLAANVQKEHDYIFEPSKGGGAPPAKGAAGGGSIKPGLKPGQTILKNPTPQQLGEFAGDIATGKMKIEYETAST